MRWGVHMQNKQLLQWLEAGSITIPSLLLQKYSELGLDEKECMLLIQIHSFLEIGNHFPTPEELSNRMTLSDKECMETIRRLIQKGMLTIEEHKDKVEPFYSESYSLVPLWETLLLSLDKTEEKAKSAEDPYTLFEKEFGRPLSPIECETLAMWIDLDKHSFDLIKAALKEAVLSSKLSFRYIDRILLEWKKNGVRSVEEAHAYGEKFRQHRLAKQQSNSKQSEKEKEASYPFYNWL